MIVRQERLARRIVKLNDHQLRHFDVKGISKVNVTGNRHLESIRLEEIDEVIIDNCAMLNDISLSEAKKSNIKNIPKLQRVNLRVDELLVENYEALKSLDTYAQKYKIRDLPNLESIEIRFDPEVRKNPIPIDSELKSLPQLTEFTCSGLSKQIASDLAELPELKQVDCNYATDFQTGTVIIKIEKGAIESLAKSKSLEKLKIDIQPEIIQSVGVEFKQLVHLKE